MSKSTSTSKSKRKIDIMPARRTIDVAPDKKIVPVPQEHIGNAIALQRWQACGDGTYRPIYRIYEREIRLSEASRALGVPHRTLQRLIVAGFVRGSQITPGYWQIDLLSWFDHVERMKDNPGFWSSNEHRRAYRDAL